MDEHFFICNGKFFISGKPIISSGNRGLRFGDGLFETMRMQEGRILNAELHFDRLFKGLKLLQFELEKYFTSNFLSEKINHLLRKNNITENARIRLMIFRGEGGIFDIKNNFPNYIIEMWPLSEKIKLNESGLVIDVFPDAKKSCDLFCNLKSNNYLPYAMAGLFVKKNKLNDALILNTYDRICESAIANIFIIKEKNIITPPLSEGCVAGIMRQWLLEKNGFKNFVIIEKQLSLADVLSADELFLTNSIHPVRWVKSFKEKEYGNEKVKEIFKYILANI